MLRALANLVERQDAVLTQGNHGEKPMTEHAELKESGGSEASELVTKARIRAEDLAADGYDIDSWLLRTLADLVEAYAKAQSEPAEKPTPLCDHDELLKVARGLANTLDGDETQRKPGLPWESAKWLHPLAPILREMANLVEEQDAALAELRAACVTCDEAIQEFRMHYPSRHRQLWEKLQAAGRLARRAAERELIAKARKSGHPTFKVPPCIDDECGTCARESDNRPPESPWSAIDDPFAPEPAPEYAGPPLPLGVADMPYKTEVLAEPVPAIEVAMRCAGHAAGGWAWQACIGNHWIEPRHTDEGHAFAETEFAVEDGNAWLAALGKQLGVPLVAVWKDKVDDEARCQICKGPVARIRGEIPTSCSGCASDF
jgi:hypothetical protein